MESNGPPPQVTEDLQSLDPWLAGSDAPEGAQDGEQWAAPSATAASPGVHREGIHDGREQDAGPRELLRKSRWHKSALKRERAESEQGRALLS